MALERVNRRHSPITYTVPSICQNIISDISARKGSSVALVALCPGHQGHFLGPLNHLGASLLAHQPAVLEEAFVSWKSVALIAERDQSEAPNASAAEFTLVLHPVRTPEDAMAVEPALHEFSLVSG